MYSYPHIKAHWLMGSPGHLMVVLVMKELALTEA